MKRMKRASLILLAAVMTAGLSAGCDKDDDADTTPQTTTTAAETEPPEPPQPMYHFETLPDETVLYYYTFDDPSAEKEYFNIAGSGAHDNETASIEWTVGIGDGDDTALKNTHKDGASYTSADNAVRLTLPQALEPGAVYRIRAALYAPPEENVGKNDKLGTPSFVINDDYPGDQGVVKFPSGTDTNNPTMLIGEWNYIDVTIDTTDDGVYALPIEIFDFRLFTNDAATHPDVWYMDNIIISRIGEAEAVKAPEWDLSLPSLAAAYKDHFLFGNIINPHQVNHETMSAAFNHHYNAVTAENAMKPVYMAPAKGVYVFKDSDAIIEWAEKNNTAVIGHTLVWHSQSAAWLTTASDGKPLTRAEAKANMEEMITAVAGKYKGRIHSWDVVNEAFTDSVSSFADWRDALRPDSPWYKAYKNGAGEGEDASDYLYDAFVFTRLADPHAILYYNDFNEEENGKRDAIVAMTNELNAKWKNDNRNTEPNRLLIEGIGMQSHHFTDSLSVQKVDDAIKAFISTGAVVSVTELDIPYGTYGSYRSRSGALNDDELAKQADLYRELFEVYVKYSDNIDRVTLWGMTDNASWRGQGYPLIFDAKYAAKPAYFSILEVAGVTE